MNYSSIVLFKEKLIKYLFMCFIYFILHYLSPVRCNAIQNHLFIKYVSTDSEKSNFVREKKKKKKLNKEKNSSSSSYNLN